ncbi:uncharacterized protein LOC106180734 [Lingula anatina]|uniref:Uncharacterized protein LOC106180734 n=1 Tax=Lingula anatina TaxID=7574 RepID=A0A1S3KCC3_LINAN|nr:uncharacterized protein LOC106180734 [Lingula anatina]|eukprot:XP_013420283.1 uncharacterized protein LOC106180734 [Lingula anatina]
MRAIAASTFLFVGIFYNAIYKTQGGISVTTLNALADCTSASDDLGIVCTEGSLCAFTPWTLFAPSFKTCVCLPGLYPVRVPDAELVVCAPVTGTTCTTDQDCLLQTADCSGVIGALIGSGFTDRSLLLLLSQVSLIICSSTFPSEVSNNVTLGDGFPVAYSLVYQMYPLHRCDEVSGQCVLPTTGPQQVPTIDFLLYVTGSNLITASEVFNLSIQQIFNQLGFTVSLP